MSIATEIEQMAEDMAKSQMATQKDFDYLKEVIKTSTSEQLKAVIPSLSKSQQILISSVLEDMAKSGEGSRGGKVIGRTSSGKPIYASANPAADHAGFSNKDHSDAAELHQKLGKKAQTAGRKASTREEKVKHMDTEMYHSSAQNFHNKVNEHLGQTKNAMDHPKVKDALSDVKEDHAAMAGNSMQKSASPTTEPESSPEPTSEEDKVKKKKSNDDIDEKIDKQVPPPKNQGDNSPEGFEGQVIKAKRIKMKKSFQEMVKGLVAQGMEKEAGCDLLCKAFDLTEKKEDVSKVWDVMAKAAEPTEKQNKEESQVEPTKDMKDKKKGTSPEPMSGESKETADEVKKSNVEATIERMQERKLEKSKCIEALAKAVPTVEAKTFEAIWDAMADRKTDAELAKSMKPSANPFHVRTIPGNCHYDVDAFLEEEEVKKSERIKSGNTFDYEPEGETVIVKSEDAAKTVKEPDVNDFIEKGLDMDRDTVILAKSNKNCQPSGAFTVNSFTEDDMVKSFHGLTKEEAEKI